MEPVPGESNPLLTRRLHRDIKVRKVPGKAGRPECYRLRNPKSRQTYEFGEEEFYLASMLGHADTLEDILEEFQSRFGAEMSPESFSDFVSYLDSLGILEPVAAAGDVAQWPQPGDEAIHEGETGGGDLAGPRQLQKSRVREKEPPHASREPETVQGRGKVPSGRRKIIQINPGPLFQALAKVLRPLRFVVWLIPPALLLAGVAVFNEYDAMTSSSVKHFGTSGFFRHLVISLFTVNLFSKLLQGAAMAHYGSRLDQFGLHLAIGVIPRFFIDRQQIQRLPRQAQLWCYAAPLLTKLGICATGILMWAVLHKGGSGLAVSALTLGQIGVASFLFTANPLWRADGYNWLTTKLGMPGLRDESFRLLRIVATGQAVPEGLGNIERWRLLSFALLTISYTVGLVIIVLTVAAMTLEQRFQGTGVIIAATIILMVATYVYGKLRRKKIRRQRASGRKGPRSRKDAETPAPAKAQAQAQGEADDGDEKTRRRLDALIQPKRLTARRWPAWVRGGLWLLVLAAFLTAMLWPYPFNVGGELVIQPSTRVEVRARTKGEVLKVLVKEGDWVQKDQVLAILSDWVQQHDVGVAGAKLNKARADLETLKAGAKPEEISLAEKRIASARVEVKYYATQLKRTTELLRKGIATQKQMDIVSGQHQSKVAKFSEAEANLAVVLSGARDSEIKAAEAELKRLEQDIVYKKSELERTRIRALEAGRIVTPRISHKLGSFLPVGGLFLVLEDNRVARAEIEVPEADIKEVKIGAPALIKLWSAQGKSISGNVVNKSPTAEERTFGKIVRVTIEVPNPDGKIRSKMTGYGKIRAAERPAWKAFTRMLVRFFTIEMWSWVP